MSPGWQKCRTPYSSYMMRATDKIPLGWECRSPACMSETHPMEIHVPGPSARVFAGVATRGRTNFTADTASLDLMKTYPEASNSSSRSLIFPGGRLNSSHNCRMECVPARRYFNSSASVGCLASALAASAACSSSDFVSSFLSRERGALVVDDRRVDHAPVQRDGAARWEHALF